MGWSVTLAALVAVGWPSPVAAQQTVTDVHGLPGWSDPDPADAAPPHELACRPSCRAGYTCIDGECVSACNPLCAPGWECTAEATCEPLALPSPPADEPVDEAPERGSFQLRVELGPGIVAAIAGSGEDDQISIVGGDAQLAAVLGTSFLERFYLDIEVWGLYAPSPGASFAAPPGPRGESDKSLTAAGLGLGATYWFGAREIFVAGALGVAALDFTADSGSAHSSMGVSVALSGGREWRVYEGLGAGLGVRFQLASIPVDFFGASHTTTLWIATAFASMTAS